MRVVVLYNEPEDATADQQDVLAQRDAVISALAVLGHESIGLSCTLDLNSVRRRLTAVEPDLVFNLVESLGGTDRLMPLATLLLDSLEIPYTGAPTSAIFATSNKLAAKATLLEAGLPTPIAFAGSMPQLGQVWRKLMPSLEDRGRPYSLSNNTWIVKPVWEHASFGMDDSAVVCVQNVSDLEKHLKVREGQLERPHFAEQFIDGREFNLSLLAGEVLPPAEIEFSSYPPGKPRIVGQRAKWEQDSFEFQQTPRRFDFSAADDPLLEQLTFLSQRCWHLFALSGYARVDFRVDDRGQPWILEINANPCLSPDAGFFAALRRADMDYPAAIEQIIADAVFTGGRPSRSESGAASTAMADCPKAPSDWPRSGI